MTDIEEELPRLRLDSETKKTVIYSVEKEWNPYMDMDKFIQ